MCGSPNTSDPLRFIDALRALPLLAVLRPSHPLKAEPRIAQLSAAGIRHVEIAWNSAPGWSRECLELVQRFPAIHLGAASVRTPQALEDTRAAGLSFAVSPVLEASLQAMAQELGVTLVPGVFSPTEVHRAVGLGCAAVKLFPAMALGPGYWSALSGPLGPLPFCIAAGGLRVSDLNGWLQAGVDAVALGATLFEPAPEPGAPPRLDPALATWVERYSSAPHQRLH
jgi:2-dehydro-3-deoxyphosphogluconate aldolase/(4S)-4-hydroxy-2-oxoglutarate aldolase